VELAIFMRGQRETKWMCLSRFRRSDEQCAMLSSP
jgi:hypothetical protein